MMEPLTEEVIKTMDLEQIQMRMEELVAETIDDGLNAPLTAEFEKLVMQANKLHRPSKKVERVPWEKKHFEPSA